MSTELKKIRNIALLGHGGNGKTTLAESILSIAGMTDRMGKVVDGNTVSDFDAEEIRRKISISAATMYANWQGYKINIIDTPGFFDFAGEVRQALRVADLGIICVSAKDGLNVGAEKSWKYLKEADKPRAIYISKLDEDHADFDKTFDQLRAAFGNSVCALTAPIKDGDKYIGIVDVITKKAYKMDGNKRVDMAVPDSMSDRLEELYTELAESAAETSEELMEKYFETMELSPEEKSTPAHSSPSLYCTFPVTGSSLASMPRVLQRDTKKMSRLRGVASPDFHTPSGDMGMFHAFGSEMTVRLSLIHPSTSAGVPRRPAKCSLRKDL